MRIPYPCSIKANHVIIFCSCLFLVEIFQGTSLEFAALVCGSVIALAAAFNRTGGLLYPSGAYIFFFGLLAMLFGLLTKAFLGEAADSNLIVPELTMQLYFGASCGIYVAAYLAQLFRTRKALLYNLPRQQHYSLAIWSALFFGLFATALSMLPHSNGSFTSALSQLNRFLPFCILLGVSQRIYTSGGRELFSVPVVVAFSALLVQGLIGFSKEGIFTPFFCVLLAAAARRYNFSRPRIIVGAAVLFLVIAYLVPYSQIGRRFRTDGVGIRESLSVAATQVSRMSELRKSFPNPNNPTSRIRMQKMVF